MSLKNIILILFCVYYSHTLIGQCNLDFSFEKDSSSCYLIKLKNNSTGSNLIYEWDFGNGDYIVTESDSSIVRSYLSRQNELNTPTVVTLRAYYKQQGLCEAPKPCGKIQKSVKLDTMVRTNCFYTTVCTLNGQLYLSSSYLSECKSKRLFFYPFLSCSYQFKIDFGDGTSTILNASNSNYIDHVFPSEGNYNITVTSLDGNNQPSGDAPNTFTSQHTVTCKNLIAEYGKNRFFLPNAFSPNNDGINDSFRIQGDYDCLINFSIKIFDKWGEKVFESSQPDFIWDGKYKGKQLEPSVYVYSSVAEFLNNEKISKKGNITLLK